MESRTLIWKILKIGSSTWLKVFTYLNFAFDGIRTILALFFCQVILFALEPFSPFLDSTLD